MTDQTRDGGDGEDWSDQNWPDNRSQQNDIEEVGEESIEGRPPPERSLPEGMETGKDVCSRRRDSGRRKPD